MSDNYEPPEGSTNPHQSVLSKYRIQQLENAVAELRQASAMANAEWRLENKKLHDEIEKMKADEAAKERHLLIVGITTLGSIVVTLVGIIWAYRSAIFK